uniref:Phosphoribulokinase/uridine kinase domain-containing protein n=1 Tax=Guillardia theta TaxID=55529 RepID=A0A7S4NIE0_GUITH|mmetsp:Transcript_22207/g.73092  ORF Transcript_22207/g.73092 Transcript_22207/m.73092 type:complete len:514 (+) Transcript_22207:38-1579(+)
MLRSASTMADAEHFEYLFGEDADLYRRTLRLLFSLACEKIFPDRSIQGGYSIANAYWYWIQGIEAVHHNELEMIKAEMLQLVARDVKVHEEKRPYKEVLQYFIEKEQFIAAKLLSSRIPIGGMVDVKVCMIEEKPHFRLSFFPVFESLGKLKKIPFDLQIYPKGGVMLTYGSRFVDQPAITSAILELREWSKKTGVNCSADLCDVEEGDGAQKLYIHACEVRLENKISELAKQIAKRAESNRLRVVCIAGPTASGKTTFSHKLSLALRTEGVSSMPLTVDHYYLPLDRQPKYQIRHNRADVDYDSIESMDVELVQEHIMALTHGETVMTPIYNMKTGYREHPGKEMKLEEGGTLIIEGIHALNPNYTSKIPENEKFKVYISPIMTLQLDDFNVCKTTDHRLARRMSRDYLFRGNNAAKTLSMWSNVRRGEHTWIFPHQNEADFIFNSAMHCELPILKGRLDQLLRTVPPDNDNFVKCSHLLAVLDTFPTWQESPVASTSILREFIGGSAFNVH